jgi:hypothetical protein
VDWTWDYTLLLTHDPETHTTYALIVGLTAVEIDFVQNYLTTLASSTSFSAKSTVPLMTHPILLPTILLDLATDDTSFLLKLRTKLLGQIQQSTGMDRFNFLRSTASEGKRSSGVAQERHELDLDDIMLRLTCLSDWVAAQRGFVGLQKKIVEVVSSMLSGSDDRHDVIDDRAVKQVFSERLNFVKESLIAAEQKCMYLERSIGAQVQTVSSVDSMLFGTDSRLTLCTDIFAHRSKGQQTQYCRRERLLPDCVRLTAHSHPDPQRQHGYAYHRSRNTDLSARHLRGNSLLHRLL